MQGITAEYVRLQTGRPITVSHSGERTPTALAVTPVDIVRFSLPSECRFGFRFFNERFVNTRQGCKKSACPDFLKEANKHGSSKRQENPYQTERL